MSSDIERIKFAVHVTEIELAALSNADWQSLLIRVRNFLKGKAPEEDLRVVNNEVDFLRWEKEGISRPLLAKVQGVVHYTLMRILAENWRIAHGSYPPWGAGPMHVPDAVSLSANVNPSTRTADEFPMRVEIEKGQIVCDLLAGDLRSYLIYSTIEASFLFGLQRSLGRVDVSYLRRCPACKKIFFADHGRQMHCSLRCADKERKRRIRAVAKDKQAKPTKSHKGKQRDVPDPPQLVPVGPFKRPRKRLAS
jgi:hypothetical protein